MQYILTEEELNKLNTLATASRGMVDNTKLEKIVKFIACTFIPTKERKINAWTKLQPSTDPHGCIHEEENNPWYCDCCPVQDICTMPKEYSK